MDETQKTSGEDPEYIVTVSRIYVYDDPIRVMAGNPEAAKTIALSITRDLPPDDEVRENIRYLTQTVVSVDEI